jgi:hypothetical protein
MRRDSAYIFVISVLITAGIVGGAYYMSIVRPIEQFGPSDMEDLLGESVTKH